MSAPFIRKRKKKNAEHTVVFQSGNTNDAVGADVHQALGLMVKKHEHILS